MIRTKLGLLGLCAVVLGVMAMSASSAQAALSWLVLNSAKTTATELKAAVVTEKDSTHLSILMELAGVKVTTTCTNLTLSGANLEPGGKLTEGSKGTFTGCAIYSGWVALGTQLECVLKSPGAPAGTVETSEQKGELVLTEGEVQIKIEPKTVGGTIKTVRLEGCALPEVNQLRGVIYLKDALGQATTHTERHLLSAAPLTSLYIGAHSANQLKITKLHGSLWMKLTGVHNGLTWSAMDA